MKKKSVSTTSVTPKIKVKETSEAQKARTRKLAAGAIALTPAGRVVKGVSSAAKTVKIKSEISAINKARKMEDDLHLWKDGGDNFKSGKKAVMKELKRMGY